MALSIDPRGAPELSNPVKPKTSWGKIIAIILVAIAIIVGLMSIVVAVDRYVTARLEKALQRVELQNSLDQQFQGDILLAAEECDQDPDCANIPHGLADPEP